MKQISLKKFIVFSLLWIPLDVLLLYLIEGKMVASHILAGLAVLLVLDVVYAFWHQAHAKRSLK